MFARDEEDVAKTFLRQMPSFGDYLLDAQRDAQEFSIAITPLSPLLSERWKVGRRAPTALGNQLASKTVERLRGQVGIRCLSEEVVFFGSIS